MIYPQDSVELVRLLVAAVVLVSWIGAAVLWRRRSADAAPTAARRLAR